MRCLTALAWLLFLVVGTTTAAAQDLFPDSTVRVSPGLLREAMSEQVGLGYNVQVTANSTRFTAGVILRLVERFKRESPEGPPLLLHYDDWVEAYRLAAGLDPDEVPEFVSLQRRYRQSQYVDYRSQTTRIEVKKGAQPDLVVNVMAGWIDGPGVEDHYTFVDSAATPSMRVTNERVITYRLVVYHDMVIQDQISGIRGRPLDGALGVVFDIIGDGHATQSRFAVSDDGLLVTYAIARKGFISVKPVSVTHPDGTVEEGVLDDRPDLERIVERLKGDFEIEYLDPIK